jgi:hypothetical protein
MNARHLIRGGRRPILAAALLVGVLLLFGVGTAYADTTVMPPTTCPTNMGSCAASDMVTTVSNAVPVGGDTCEDPADTITIDLSVTWTPSSNQRYDLGFYISTDGDPVNNNDACVGSIAPIGSGDGPNYFANLDGQVGDLCGDVSKTAPVVWTVRTTVPCQPNPNIPNTLAVQACRVWDNNVGVVCKNLADAGTGSKCDCSLLSVTQIPVPSAAKITVIKDVVPDTYTDGRFNLYIDEKNNGTIDDQVTNVGDGGQLGPVTVPAGTNLNPGATHLVGETAYTGTDLANFDTTITCVKAGGTPIGPAPGTTMLVTVQPNDDWTCTIKNTAHNATITVKKTALNLAGTAYCPPRTFGFSLTGQPAFGLRSTVCTAGDPNIISEKSFTVIPGNYTIAETDPDINLSNGWLLTNVVCTGSGVNGDFAFDSTSGQKSVTGGLGPDETVTCEFTNQQATPLAVELLPYSAMQTADGVTVAWETVSETANAGFNVYRGTADAGPWTKLNAALIAAQTPGAAQGNAYTYVDKTALAAGTYYYALEDVSTSGNATRHTPVSVTVAGPNAVTLRTLNASAANRSAIVALLALVVGGLGLGLAWLKRQ